jgi:hypothetical protein
VLKRIFRPKRDEVTGEWRRLHNEELHHLYSSPTLARVIKSRRMRWTVHVAQIGEGSDMNRVLVGKPEGKRTHVFLQKRFPENCAGCDKKWKNLLEPHWPQVTV